MNIRAWSISLLLFLSTVTAVGQTANRYLKAPLPNGWEENGEVFVKVLEDAGVYKCTEEGRKAFERFINTL